MLVALLLPAWALGHLFLAVFPAPAGTGATALKTGSSKSNTALVQSKDAAGTSDLKMGGGLDSAEGSSSKISIGGDSDPAKLLAQIEELKTANERLVDQNNAASESAAKVASQNTLIADLQRQLQMAESQAKESPTASVAATRQAEAQAKQLASLTEQYQTLSARSAELESQVSTLTDEKQQLLEQARMSSGDQAETEKLKSLTQDLERQLSESDAELKRQTELVASLKSSAAAKTMALDETALNEQKLAIAESKNKIASLESAFESAMARLTNANAKLDARNQELLAARAELQTAKSRPQATVSEDADSGLVASNNQSTDSPVGTMTAEPQTEKPRAVEVYRFYTSSRGNRSKLAFVRWQDGDVVVRSFNNQKLYQLPLNRFSEADQQYLRELK
jgi:cell division protein FtsB